MDGRIANCAKMNEARRIDITGLRCNALTVVEMTNSFRGNHRLWRCRCDCGKDTLQVSFFLRAGRIKSCGCMTKKIISAARTRHGETDSPTWRSWKSMHERCYLVAHKSHADYGGRGIKVCDRWHTYENFRADMGERPPGKTLGRIDNDGPYEPGNCEWQTMVQQARNRRSSALIEHNGKIRCREEWAQSVGLTSDAFGARLRAGWTMERALSTPAKRQINSRCTFVADPR